MDKKDEWTEVARGEAPAGSIDVCISHGACGHSTTLGGGCPWCKLEDERAQWSQGYLSRDLRIAELESRLGRGKNRLLNLVAELEQRERGTTHWEGCAETHWPCRVIESVLAAVNELEPVVESLPTWCPKCKAVMAHVPHQCGVVERRNPNV